MLSFRYRRDDLDDDKEENLLEALAGSSDDEEGGYVPVKRRREMEQLETLQRLGLDVSRQQAEKEK